MAEREEFVYQIEDVQGGHAAREWPWALETRGHGVSGPGVRCERTGATVSRTMP